MKSIISRFFIWILVIGITFGGYNLYKWISTPKTPLYASCTFNNYQELSELQDIKISGYKTEYNKGDNPTLIISKPNENIEGYKEYNKYIYSPMVLYTGNFVLDKDTGFIVSNLDNSQDYRTASKNLTIILEGIENNKTWGEIGINVKELKDKKVSLVIPDKYSQLMPYVKEMFFANLTENKELSEEEFTNTMNRVNKIINKCTKVEDLKSYLDNAFEKDDISFVAVGPEYLMNDNSSFSAENNEYVVPVYPQKTTAAYYSLYIADGTEQELIDKIIDKYTGKKLKQEINFRTIYNKDAEHLDRSSRYVDNINIIDIPIETNQKISSFISTIQEEDIKEQNENIETPEEKTEETETGGLTGLEIFFIILGCVIGLAVIIFLIWLFYENYWY